MWSGFDKKVLNYNDYYNYVAKFDYSKYVLSVDKFKELSQAGGVVTLDLRSKKEYDLGHVRGGQCILVLTLRKIFWKKLYLLRKRPF